MTILATEGGKQNTERANNWCYGTAGLPQDEKKESTDCGTTRRSPDILHRFPHGISQSHAAEP